MRPGPPPHGVECDCDGCFRGRAERLYAALVVHLDYPTLTGRRDDLNDAMHEFKVGGIRRTVLALTPDGRAALPWLAG